MSGKTTINIPAVKETIPIDNVAFGDKLNNEKNDTENIREVKDVTIPVVKKTKLKDWADINRSSLSEDKKNNELFDTDSADDSSSNVVEDAWVEL